MYTPAYALINSDIAMYMYSLEVWARPSVIIKLFVGACMACGIISASILIARSASNGISVLVCFAALVLVCALRLYKVAVYRLSLYQVLTALAFSIVSTIQVMMVDYDTDVDVYSRVCIVMAYAFTCIALSKLMFSLWVTFHLVSFAVCQKNLKRLEVLYVMSSLVIPALVAVVPFTTDTYGLSGSWCWIETWKGNCPNETSLEGVIEQFSLWLGPAMFTLLASSTAMVVMVIVLAYRVLHRLEYMSVSDRNQYWTALKQLLPLAAYPILFCIFFVPVFVQRVSDAATDHPNYWLTLISGLSTAAWGLVNGLTLLIHISVSVLCVKKQKMQTREDYGTLQSKLLPGQENKSIPSKTQNSNTIYDLVTED